MRRNLPHILLVCALAFIVGSACVVRSHPDHHHSRRTYPSKHDKHDKHKKHEGKGHHDHGNGHGYGHDHHDD